MGGVLGGGGGGTTQVQQSNVPFNASELHTIQGKAIDLLNNNQINYTPYGTYAGPSGYTQTGLTNVGNHSLYGGDLTGDSANVLQQNALIRNNDLLNGNSLNAYLGPLGTTNPAASATTNLDNTFGPNGWFPSGAQNFSNFLTNMTNSGAAQNLGTIGSGQFLNAQAPWESQLASSGANGPGIAPLANVSNGTYLNSLYPTLAALQQAPNSSPEAGALGSIAGGNYLAGASPYLSGLQQVANPYADPAAAALASTATGTYLGPSGSGNPYLEATFNAAARPVTNAFQTAVAPGVDSRFESAGRFNSGLNGNAQDIAEQNLGKTLSDLGASIYGPAYEAERNRMVQGATSLGNLETSALGTAGGLYNQGVNTIGTGAAALGGIRNADLSSSGQLYNTGVNTLSGASTSLADLYQRGLTNALSAQNTGVGIAANAADAQFRNQNTAFTNAGTLYNNAGDIIRNAMTNSGSLNTLGANSQIQALNSFLGSQQNAINAAPQLSQIPVQDWQTAINAGTAQQQNEQARLNDINQRFYGLENSPWQTLGQAASIVGSGIPGTSTTTQPYFTNPLGQLAGGVGAANSLFGSNGLFGGAGGLFGGGVANAVAPTVANASALFPGAIAAGASSLTPELASAYIGANTGGAFAGGLSSLLPFAVK